MNGRFILAREAVFPEGEKKWFTLKRPVFLAVFAEFAKPLLY